MPYRLRQSLDQHSLNQSQCYHAAVSRTLPSTVAREVQSILLPYAAVTMVMWLTADRDKISNVGVLLRIHRICGNIVNAAADGVLGAGIL